MRPAPLIAVNILEPLAPLAAIPSSVSAAAQLICRFRSGDRDAFAEIYRAHHAAVFRFAFQMTADPDAAAEITHETFVWLIHHPDRYDATRGELPAFLAGVARQMLRRRNRFARRWLPFDRAAESSHGDKGVENSIDAESLRQAIARLPIRYREVVVLCDLEEKSYDEAAQHLHCAVGTIRSRLHRGRELLARKFLPNRETRK